MRYRLERNEELLVGSFYRSPSSASSNNILLNEVLKEISAMNFPHMLLVGDFNYPDIDWDATTCSNGENSKEFLFIECIRDCFLKQHVLCPTRCRGDATASVLDLVLTRDDDDAINSLELTSALGKSDHSMIEITLSLDTPESRKRVFFMIKQTT